MKNSGLNPVDFTTEASINSPEIGCASSAGSYSARIKVDNEAKN